MAATRWLAALLCAGWCASCGCVGQAAAQGSGRVETFHLEEALGGVFDVALRDSWDDAGVGAGAGVEGSGVGGVDGDDEGEPEADSGVDEVSITSRFGRRFTCRVPRPAAPSAEADRAPPFDADKALKSMRGACLATSSGWWSYELCFEKEVKQFHLLADGTRLDTSSLGTFVGSEVSAEGEPPSVTQRFEGGTICDLTGRPREAVVTYSCQPGSHEQVVSIAEASTCVYRISVVTNLLCPPSKLAATPIVCVPRDAASSAAAGTPGGLAGSEAAAAAAAAGAAPGWVNGARGDERGEAAAHHAAPLAEGDVWHGTYTCQGEQGFALRVMKRLPRSGAGSGSRPAPTDRVTFAGVLGFHHTLASGVYRVLIVVDPSDRRLTVVPGPWVHKPSDFIPLGFRGSIDPDGGMLYGVLPECDDGPWWLRKRGDASASDDDGGGGGHGHVAAMLEDMGVSMDDVLPDVDLDDDAWPQDGDLAAGEGDGDGDELGVNIVATDSGAANAGKDAVARIRQLLKAKLGKDVDVKFVTVADDEDDAGDGEGAGGDEEGYGEEEGDDGEGDALEEDETEGPVPPPRQRKGFSAKDVRRVVDLLTEQVKKATTRKEMATAEAESKHAKRLRMEQMYRGRGGQGGQDDEVGQRRRQPPR